MSENIENKNGDSVTEDQAVAGRDGNSGIADLDPDAKERISAEMLAAGLQYSFRRPALLHQALTHASAAGPGRPSNERLEFLGDRVLGLIVAELLYERFPDEPEGDMAKRHTALVRREALAEVAREIRLDLALVQNGCEGSTNDTLLADGMEAVIAALYLDGGLAAARAFIEMRWSCRLMTVERPPKDAKTTLQEWAQGRGRPLPVYRVISRTGPPHAPQFTVEVLVQGEEPCVGCGPSKRLAGQRAAGALLLILGEFFS